MTDTNQFNEEAEGRRIAELETDLDRLRSENEALWEQLKTAREAADEIAWAVRDIPYVAGFNKLLDATELVLPETADRHTQEAYRDKRIAELLSAARYALESLDAIDVPQEWDCRELLRTAIAKATGAAPEKEPSE